MVTPSYSYTKTEPAKIAATLASLFSAFDQQEGAYGRSASSNMLLLVSSSSGLPEIEILIDQLAVMHPARFFIIYPDSSLTLPVVEVSARCHSLTKSTHICSEIIRIGVNDAGMKGAASLVRSNLLTGLPTELMLADAELHRLTVETYASMADVLLLDSCDFEVNFNHVLKLASLTKAFFDFAWVALGTWRDEIKAIFSRTALSEMLPTLERIEITFGPSAHSSHDQLQISPAALLFSGWLISRLGFQVGHRIGDNRLQCQVSSGHSIELAFMPSDNANSRNLSQVQFGFRGSYFVKLRRTNMLETIIQTDTTLKSARYFDDDSKLGRIKRQFLIGESAVNYPSALKTATDIHNSLMLS